MNDRPILQSRMPDGQSDVAAARLPSMRPVVGPWLTYDDAYADQMTVRRALISDNCGAVYAQTPQGLAAACGFLELALAALPDGYEVAGEDVHCPDGAIITLNWDSPLKSVGQILQQDVCILEKQGPEHVLSGAILCFPASWTLAQKIGKPLVRIHKPVDEYDSTIAARVQRLFDGVQTGRPLWRANALRYDDASLFQPRPENDPRPVGSASAPFLRSERQTILRLPQPDAVAFVIHTTVIAADLENEGESGNTHQSH